MDKIKLSWPKIKYCSIWLAVLIVAIFTFRITNNVVEMFGMIERGEFPTKPVSTVQSNPNLPKRGSATRTVLWENEYLDGVTCDLITPTSGDVAIENTCYSIDGQVLVHFAEEGSGYHGNDIARICVSFDADAINEDNSEMMNSILRDLCETACCRYNDKIWDYVLEHGADALGESERTQELVTDYVDYRSTDVLVADTMISYSFGDGEQTIGQHRNDCTITFSSVNSRTDLS